MTLGELAKETDVPASTIRYWESIGVLPAPERAGRWKLYPTESIERVALLKLAQTCGFTLGEIRRFQQEPCGKREPRKDRLVRLASNR